MDPIQAPGSPAKYRLRVRMYRQGLGDCFLLTFPRQGTRPLNMLIDCGALGRDAEAMTGIVKHIRDTIADGDRAVKPRLDVVVGTHEHKDHLSGFNQARDVFNEIEFGAVWLGWTENLTEPQVRKIKETRKKAVAKLQLALDSELAKTADLSIDDELRPVNERFSAVRSLLEFTSVEDKTPTGTVLNALEYLKARGKSAGGLSFLEPGGSPIQLPGMDDVRVYVLGPPRDPIALKTSAVTEAMKRDGVIYHLSRTGDVGIDALAAAFDQSGDADNDRYHPFAVEHRIPRPAIRTDAAGRTSSPYYAAIEDFVKETYDNPTQRWRRIDHDWLRGFGQLALDLDSDTNNTSLALAFEFIRTGDVLLFPADAQIGNWQSWAKLEFNIGGNAPPVRSRDLLNRTAFYKVGHHCSHNATLKTGGLELMNRDDLIAFIPLDKETAKKQGTKGWQMPAQALFKALKDKTQNRVVLSDVMEDVPAEAGAAGVVSTGTYIDYFLK